MACERIHPLLAGYVDGELTDLERKGVEEHVAKCDSCRALLDEQRSAAETYGLYPVEEASEAEWEEAWDNVQARLPARSKRLTLESLAELDLQSEFAAEEEGESRRPAAGAAQKSRPASVPTEAERRESAPAARGAVRATGLAPGGAKRPHRERPWFKPMRIPRLRHMQWAHVAGLAVPALIVLVVILSVKPVLRTDQLAVAGQVEISFDVTGSEGDPMVIMLPTDAGGEVPLIWVAQAPEDSPSDKEESVQ